MNPSDIEDLERVPVALAQAFTRAAQAYARSFERYARAFHAAPGLVDAWRAVDADDRRELLVNYSCSWNAPSSAPVRAAWRELRRAATDFRMTACTLGLEWHLTDDSGAMGVAPEVLAQRVPTLLGSLTRNSKKRG